MFTIPHPFNQSPQPPTARRQPLPITLLCTAIPPPPIDLRFGLARLDPPLNRSIQLRRVTGDATLKI